MEILFVVAYSPTFVREFTAYVFQELSYAFNSQTRQIQYWLEAFLGSWRPLSGRIILKRALKSSCQRNWPEVQMTQKGTTFEG